MPLYLSRNLVLTFDPWDEDENGNFPVIGWHNLITINNVSASYENEAYPATNLANPSTAARWQSTQSTVQYITIDVQDGDGVDYVGLARHNFGSTGATVEVQALPIGTTSAWQTVSEERLLPNDQPTILRFERQPVGGVRLRIVPNGVPPRLAVMHVGRLLQMPRGLQEGHVPAHLASSDDIVTGLAESGDYLGRLVTRQALSSGVSFKFISKHWFDANMLDFVRVARGAPFFFAWMPDLYPDEASYAWTTSDIRPETLMLARGVFVNLDFSFDALAI
ncbi:hypothetical protein [Devosia aurantiaca]|uniref:F5/8 type C domain-containing protein n=1 Tax=Devosia aurantiaca TaxID=2714858 RepID=A0A6M1SV73_9HYPH|nr:hypothetical protein [Devosia aurantiaca]NGP19292.1 hypothetical protein [Devosia aurantiaca]